MDHKFSEGNVIKDSHGTKVRIIAIEKNKFNDSKYVYAYTILESNNPSAVGRSHKDDTEHINKYCTLVSCDHKWRHYVGVTHVYDFCELCDEKKYK